VKRTGQQPPPLFLLACALLAAACLAPAAAVAQGEVRSLGLAGAYTAAARGLDAVAWNPANLALHRSSGVELNLVSFAVDLHNNSFSLSRYNAYTGATLTDADKALLLSDIPVEGLIVDADVHAGALGLCVGPFALTVQGSAAGRGVVDRDFFDLILMGNEIGQSFDFTDTDGEARAFGAVTLSWATPLHTSRTHRLSAGINVRYLHGLYDLRVERAEGGLTFAPDRVFGKAEASYLTAEGGSGYAVDLGLTLQAPRGWVLGLAVDNVGSHLRWDSNVERHLWYAAGDSLTATTDDLDAHVDSGDSTVAAAPYTDSLTPVLRLGVSNRLGALLFDIDLHKGLRDVSGRSDDLDLSIGMEWELTGWLRPRWGVGFGGDGNRSAAGLGLLLGPLRWDLAVANHGELVPDDTKGLAFASGVALRF